jgi:tyrosyl-tRNA synthetase
MMQQSAVSVDGEKVTDPAAMLPDASSCVVKVGKRRFVRIVGRSAS